MARQPKKAARSPEDGKKRKGRVAKKAAPAQVVSEEPKLCRRGRPTLYTPEIAAEILYRLADGETLPTICKDEHMPARVTVMKWADEDREGFYDRYRRARECQRDSWADDMVTISDDGTNDFMERQNKDGETTMVYNREHVDRSKLRVGTRQWLLKVGSPTKYGDKIEQTHKADAAFTALWQRMGGGKTKQPS